jgi:pimeloyl-ACP methyl ester carboxylesterase
MRERIETGSVVVDGIPTFFRRIRGEGPPVVMVHGVPTHSEDWVPFLERMRGPAIALDLPAFGRSARPPADSFDCSMRAYADFFELFLEQMELDRYSLALHDWGGAVGLIVAQRDPARLQRLFLANTVPLLPGYRWHRTARAWRTRGLGEIVNRLWSRPLLALALRESRGDWGRQPREFVDYTWDHLDRGTMAAILRLYRSAPEPELALAGRGLGSLEAPALVVWGLRDRFLPARFGRAHADALPNAELCELPQAGHWPWLDEPAIVERVVAFLEPRLVDEG